jgi:hypothetical protein
VLLSVSGAEAGAGSSVTASVCEGAGGSSIFGSPAISHSASLIQAVWLLSSGKLKLENHKTVGVWEAADVRV